MKSLTLIAIVFSITSCDKLLHREAPEAAPPSPSVLEPSPVDDASLVEDASREAGLGLHIDDEDDPLAGLPTVVLDAAPEKCPVPIHPNYCRRNCRNWTNRVRAMHARRVSSPTRSGVGTCGGFNVFAEDGTNASLVEYFDPKTDQLVGAVDKKQTGCNQYGTIPKCTPSITWGPAHPFAGGLGGLAPPPNLLK